ncbi:MAG: chemotaxis response regulator protein-glutamate methylesterase [Synergistaceae bacterium]|jgi:two-component system chemotaxis response regulator CheB|nr:chemotaxis response regulator protein-glutamate methylesterase [Synergistaceae bacterium]
MIKDRKIRVLIVDDSAFMRKVIGDILSSNPAIEIAGRVKNGDEALKCLRESAPDVITLDVEMPGKNGLEVLREIISIKPVPVVMVSSLTKEGANITMQALDAGAVDFVTKPSGTISLDMEKIGGELLQKVLAASRASVQNAFSRSFGSKRLSVPQSPERRKPLPVVPRGASQRKPELLVIAASTGGPNALQELVPALGEDFPLPVLIVQHMPPGFTSSFAHRLDERSRLKVTEGSDGMPVRRGVAVVAPGGYHMLVERHSAELVCRLSETPPVRSVRPSADVLFASVADVIGGPVVVVVLTGMGKDGLDGTRLLRAKGSYVFAESKETCVIFGMPGAVVDAGLADEVLPIYSIAAGVERVLKN